MLDYRTQILPYLRVDENGLPLNTALLHAGYDETKKIAEKIKAVFGEEYPKFLDKNRPKEKAEHKLYRREIYKNTVNQFRTKVLDMATTVYQNDDFNVTFNDIQKTDTLQEYTEKKLFTNNSLVEWHFKDRFQQSVDDPNSVVAAFLKAFPMNDATYNDPKLMLVGSEGVIYFDDEFCVLRGEEKTLIEIDGKKSKVGRNLYFYDKDSFVICKQKAKKIASNNNGETLYVWDVIANNIQLDEYGNIVSLEAIAHNCGKIPAMKIGRILGKKIDGEIQIYKSEVSDALPFLESILQRVSDTEIELLMHIHSIEYYYLTKQQCKATGCKDGYVQERSIDPDAGPIFKKCPQCDNRGFPVNGIENIIITIPESNGLDGTNGLNIPAAPPAGTIPRNIATVQELRTEIENQWKFAWSTINAQWLMESPNATSGTSKGYDRQEYERRLAEIALHIDRGLAKEYEWIASMRYSGNIQEILPNINIPTDSFNLFTQEEALNEYSLSIEKGMDGAVISGLEVIYTEKKFGVHSKIKKRLDLIAKIDPFLSLKGKNKNEVLMRNLFDQIKIFGTNSPQLTDIIRQTYLSLNIDSIVTTLSNADSKFFDLPFDAQKEQIGTELVKYIPSSISEDIYKTIKQEPLTDFVGQ